MTHVLFKRIVFSYLLITAVLLISLELYLSNTITTSYISNLKGSLITQAGLIADHIPSSVQKDLDDVCRNFKTKTGARVTIIDSSGRVLGDSDEPSAVMENHGDRPEIKDAEISDTGSSVRYSKTLRKNLLYIAVAIPHGSGKRFLRLSVPLIEIEQAIRTMRMRVIVAAVAVFCAVILLGIFQTRRITRSIEEITDFSKEVAAGNFRRRLFLQEKGEIGELGKNISGMAQELGVRLQQSEEEKNKVEAILRNMSDGLILTDTKGTIMLSNTAVKTLFSLQSDCEGKTLMESLRNPDLPEIVDEVVKFKERVVHELALSSPTERYLMATATPFYSSHPQKELSGVVMTFHDITRLRKLEQIRKDFVANVSHEIKTPITAIKGFAETLIEGALYDKENAAKFLLMIKNHSERLNSLVDDLLTLSRIELGDIEIRKEHLHIHEVIDSVFTTLADKAQSKRLYLKKEISPEASEIDADRNRLIQILLNLVDNGTKFTEKGGITVSVKKAESKEQRAKEPGTASPITHDLSPADFIEITVTDTGMGIPKKHLPRMGERFYRVDRARSRELGGTGLGLAIVKHLVKAHGWEMEIESSEGTGTAVRLICPTA
jgi:two-component system phosphate regulon sensor histidine kinase PhoR